MQRLPEDSEIMDDEKQAFAYASADFRASNALFVDHFHKNFASLPPGGRVVDLGCGPGDIILAMSELYPQQSFVGIDGSAAMLALFSQKRRSREAQIELRCAYIPDFTLAPGFSAVMSNSLLHHLADPASLWEETKRLGASGCAVAVMDLYRPQTTDEARGIVKRYAADASDFLKEDFYRSLLAAYTPEEVAAQLQRAELADYLKLQVVSDRHFLVSGRLP